MDSDEDEMASMRASSRHTGGRSSASSAGPGDAREGSSYTGTQARVPAPALAPYTATGSSSQPDAPESDNDSDEAPPDSMRAACPVSFGKKEPDRKINPAVHNSTARVQKTGAGARVATKGAVQFGPRLMDSATVAGASSRAAKASQAIAESKPSEEDVGMSAPPQDYMHDSESDADNGPAGSGGHLLPVSHEVHIPAHEKAVTALSFDPKAARMVSGGMDGVVKFFDFGGMSEEKNFFRTVEPVSGHMVQAISFDPTGSCLLVVCSDVHARIYDRDGTSKPINMTVNGDMYVRDMQHTKGHTQMLTSGQWHPMHAENWLTSSLDGTLRIWDINAQGVGMDRRLPSMHVLKTLDRRNVCVGGAGRAGGLHPGCCAYSPNDGKKIVGGCTDGSVQVFNEKARMGKPDKIVREAHSAAVTDIKFIQEGTACNLMVTRGLDAKMRVWDTRMLSDTKGPVKSFDNLPAIHEKTGLCVSPDGQYLVTGSTGATKQGSASVHIFSTKDFSSVRTLDFGKRTALRFHWPKELNQLIVGTGTGEVAMMYNPKISQKGALNFVGRHAKTKKAGEEQDLSQMPIFNMSDGNDIKKFYATGHGNMYKIRRAETRQSQKTLTPMRPPSTEGSVGAMSDSANFAALVLQAGAKRLNLQKTSGQEPDSQKALLSYQDKAQKDPILVERAYAKNQPVKLLDWSVDESEGDKRMSSKMEGDFCRKCGQKVCRCVDYSNWGQKKKRIS